MVPHLIDAQHYCSLNDDEDRQREKAWHIVAVLLCIGCPTNSEEVALKCGLFAASPQYVRHLCSIPNSPLCLVEDRIISVSAAAVWAFKEFACKVIGECAPRSGIRISGVKTACDDVRTYFRRRKVAELGSVVLPVAKRRLFLTLEDGEQDRTVSTFASQIQEMLAEQSTDIANARDLPLVNLPDTEEYLGNLNQENAIAPLHLDSLAVYSRDNKPEVGTICREVFGSVPTSNCWDSIFNFKTDLSIMGRVMESRADLSSALLCRLCEEAQTGGSGFSSTSHVEADELLSAPPPTEAGEHYSCVHKVSMNQLIESSETNVEVMGKKGGVLDSGTFGDPGNCVLSAKPSRCKVLSMDPVGLATLDNDQTIRVMDFASPEPSSLQIRTMGSFVKVKSVLEKALPKRSQVFSNSITYNKISLKQQGQCKEGKRFISLKLKSKRSHKHTMQAEENVLDSCSSKGQVEHKTLPHFDSFLVEDEEGSGGYGTVYRARSKNNGKRFAIKCPHENAHRHHVNNEQKMLERFGGRNFIINYRGSFRFGNADCFILEHVEHDRPETLKREIDIFELQWYGYCMFKALAYLHKQGVAHRDVKPGNFLFSRTLKKGYLIDFNLAMDLQQKYAIGSKTKSKHSVSFDHVPLPHLKSTAMTKEKKLVRGDSFPVSGRPRVDSQPSLEPRNMKKKATVSSLKAYPGVGKRNIFGSQGGDGSGITSAKDATSNRTPSAQRPREPVPCLGRKELINLVQGAMQSPSHVSVNILASQRKRVSAPPSKVDSKMLYLSPMPLHSSGVAVAGAGLLKSKGDGKHKREGPCVGTKGFRAPEVLFRSSHQGFKADVWSAGVTLLYLAAGRTPFVGEPEQNIKDIAKLRGSEDLWELAKLHNRESSFPPELFDIQSLPSVKLQEWCRINTKRPNFFKLIPAALFDLVEKCLTVNPRLRISAEEALRHDFFAPCHESLKKQRMLSRQELSLDQVGIGNGHHLLHGQGQASQVL